MAQAAGVEHIRALLRAAGRAETVRELPDSTRTAAEAAAALGCDVAQIGKSIILIQFFIQMERLKRYGNKI